MARTITLIGPRLCRSLCDRAWVSVRPTVSVAVWLRTASRARAEEQMRAEELERPEPAPHLRPQVPSVRKLGGQRIEVQPLT